MRQKKVIILLLDSFGIGASADAVDFGDQGSDTLGHIVDYFKSKNIPFKLPHLSKRGLQAAAESSRGKPLSIALSDEVAIENAKYGYCIETSKGKDTPSGHWEIAGVPVLFDWCYFEKKPEGSVFPEHFINAWVKKANLSKGFIDAGHASGTDVLRDLGDEHIQSGKPIVYTSGDSVFQVAAHETHFGLERLYEICQAARETLDELNMCVGRVIARPFIGDSPANYARTGNRHDYSVLPPEPTLLDHLKSAGGNVVAIGKIADIYANQGITEHYKATGLDELFEQTKKCYQNAQPNTLIFTNFVDFDSSFGHRRDIEGYGKALMYLDSRLPELDAMLDEDTIVIASADHGCDPSWEGTDHTREHVPFLLWGKNIDNQNIGGRSSFADIGQTIADYMGIVPLSHGKSIFK